MPTLGVYLIQRWMVPATLQWHGYDGAQPAHRAFPERDITAVALGDVACDGEPEPGIALVLVAGVVEPIERPEDVVALQYRDARAVVVDLDAQPLALGCGANDDVVAEP